MIVDNARAIYQLHERKKFWPDGRRFALLLEFREPPLYRGQPVGGNGSAETTAAACRRNSEFLGGSLA
jgi:hypothetical protein